MQSVQPRYDSIEFADNDTRAPLPFGFYCDASVFFVHSMQSQLDRQFFF